MGTLRPYAPALLAVATVALLSWPVTGDLRTSTISTVRGRSRSTRASHDGLNYGPELLFTYGPLGFLHKPLLVYPWPARFAFMWVCDRAARGRRGHRVVAAQRAALVVLAVLVGYPSRSCSARGPGTAIAFFGASRSRADRRVDASDWSSRPGSACSRGVELLLKLNAGVTSTRSGRSGRSRPGSATGLTSPSRAPAWPRCSSAGSSPASRSRGPRLRVGSLGIISGYSEAMIYEEPMREWEPWAAALLGGIGAFVAWRAGDALPRRAQLGLVLLWTVLAFTAFKAAFVRHDAGHTNIYFASVLGALIAFGWAPHRRQTAWLLGALFAVTLLASGGPTPRTLYTPARARGQLLRPAAPADRRQRHQRGIADRATSARPSSSSTVASSTRSATAPSTSSPRTRGSCGRSGCAGSRCRSSRATRPTRRTSTTATPTWCARRTGRR